MCPALRFPSGISKSNFKIASEMVGLINADGWYVKRSLLSADKGFSSQHSLQNGMDNGLGSSHSFNGSSDPRKRNRLNVLFSADDCRDAGFEGRCKERSY